MTAPPAREETADAVDAEDVDAERDAVDVVELAESLPPVALLLALPVPLPSTSTTRLRSPRSPKRASSEVDVGARVGWCA